jgi:hypothetical protein
MTPEWTLAIGNSRDEEAAFAWAVDFFRRHAADMLPGGSGQVAARYAANVILTGWENDMRRCPEKDAGTAAIELLEKLSDVVMKDGSSLTPHIIAAMIERGDDLPRPLAEFNAKFLRDPEKWRGRGTRGRKSTTAFGRDLYIGCAVGILETKYGFPPTRNRAAKHPCGTSIVVNALNKTIKSNVSEADIERIFTRWRKWTRATQGIVVDLGDMVMVFHPDDPSRKLS